VLMVLRICCYAKNHCCLNLALVLDEGSLQRQALLRHEFSQYFLLLVYSQFLHICMLISNCCGFSLDRKAVPYYLQFLFTQQARTVVTATNSPRVLGRSWAAQSGWRASVATRLPLGLALPLASMASVRANFASGSREYGLKNTSLWRLLMLSTLKVMLLLR